MKLFIILTREWPYFLDNVLARVKIIFLPNCFLILSLLKHRSVRHFWTKKKMRISNKGSSLNSTVV